MDFFFSNSDCVLSYTAKERAKCSGQALP
jgi:hypothetical protein